MQPTPAPRPLRPRTLTLDSATIADLGAAMAKGTLTSERLVQMCLARAKAYEPTLRAIIALNPEALDTARALDAERKAKGPRSALHGIPVALKDNFDTADMPTTGGSWVLAGSIPMADSTVVRKLRDAGAIILAKANMSEFAAGPPISSVMGQTYNPYNHDYIAGGSSGGSGAVVAAAYVPLALGTDTGGSVRGPSAIDGIVGLKPTNGLLSNDGVIPLGLTFDTPGPMARTVRDVAISLGIIAEPEHGEADYTKFLDPRALKGARLGFVRTFMGNDPDYDAAIERAAAFMRASGATVVDIRYPAWMMTLKGPFYTKVRWPEFRPQIAAYLARLKPGYPRTLEELAARSDTLKEPNPQGYVRNDARWALFKTELESGATDDPEYRMVHDHGLPLMRSGIDFLLATNHLNALFYLTTSVRPPRVGDERRHDTPATFGGSDWATQFANLSGLPELVVPCGYTHDGLPIGMSILGPAFAEGRILAFGYAFEQAARVRHAPPATPPLPGEEIVS